MNQTKVIRSIGLFAAIALAMASIGCAVHHRVYHVTPDQQLTREGVIYCLPKTQLTFTLPVTLTEQTPGEFFRTKDPNNVPNGGLSFDEQMSVITNDLINLEIINSN